MDLENILLHTMCKAAPAPLGRPPPSRAENAITWCARGAVVATVACAAAGGPADAAVAWAWRRLLAMPATHNCMCEALVATASFWAWITLYQLLDTVDALARRFRLDRAPAKPFAENHSARGAVEAGVYVGAVALFHLARARAPLERAPPTAARLVFELAFGLIAYDGAFFFLHRLLHARRAPRWLRRAHRAHHGGDDAAAAAGGALRASATTHHSLLDGTLQVVVNVLVQQRAPCWARGRRWPGLRAKHDLARLWHNVAVTYMLVECHSGWDAPWGMHRVAPGLLGGAPAHERHHAGGDVCFAQFSTYLDRLCGTGPGAKRSPPAGAADK